MVDLPIKFMGRKAQLVGVVEVEIEARNGRLLKLSLHLEVVGTDSWRAGYDMPQVRGTFDPVVDRYRTEGLL